MEERHVTYQDGVRGGKRDGIRHFHGLAHPLGPSGDEEQLVAGLGQLDNVQLEGIRREFHLHTGERMSLMRTSFRTGQMELLCTVRP